MKQTTKGKLYSVLNSTLLFIEHYWQYILAAILIIGVIVSIRKCDADYNEAKDLKTVERFNDTSYTSEIKKWKDAYNREHTRAENLTVDIRGMKVAGAVIAKESNIKPKQITAISKAGLVLSLNVKPIVETIWDTISFPENDSVTIINVQNFYWKDKWMQVNGTIGGNADTLIIYGTDTLSRVDYWGRKHWYSGKTQFTDFTNTNPHIKIEGYKGIELRQSKKKWNVGVGIQIGYPINNINLRRPVVQVGLSVNRTILSF